MPYVFKTLRLRPRKFLGCLSVVGAKEIITLVLIFFSSYPFFLMGITAFAAKM